MDPILPYIATAISAAGLLGVLMARGTGGRLGGSGVGVLGLAWLYVMAGAPGGGGAGLAEGIFSLVFSLLAIASSVQMITQRRPVYSALFFVLVVLSVCGMLVMMEAFFMAFSLVIVYAGAILITYMFVLMLAQQASDTAHDAEIPEYDRKPRDPRAAVVVAGMCFAIVVSVGFTGVHDLPPAAGSEARLQADAALLRSLPGEVQRLARTHDLQLPGTTAEAVHIGKEGLMLRGTQSDGTSVTVPIEGPGNTAHVGWHLVAGFPASLEVAGVILLMAMFGAVVLSRRQVEHAESELLSAVSQSDHALDQESEG